MKIFDDQAIEDAARAGIFSTVSAKIVLNAAIKSMIERGRLSDEWKRGMEQAAGMVSDDEFWTDGDCTWSSFLSDKYQEAVRTAIAMGKSKP